MKLLACIVFAAIAWNSAAHAEDQSARAAFGEMTYRLSCAVCHGRSGRGDGDMATDLIVSAPDLTTLAERNGGQFPEAYVTKVITGGAAVTVHGGQMPAWGLIFLKDAESYAADGAALVKRRIADLVAYLRSIQSTGE